MSIKQLLWLTVCCLCNVFFTTLKWSHHQHSRIDIFYLYGALLQQRYLMFNQIHLVKQAVWNRKHGWVLWDSGINDNCLVFHGKIALWTLCPMVKYWQAPDVPVVLILTLRIVYRRIHNRVATASTVPFPPTWFSSFPDVHVALLQVIHEFVHFVPSRPSRCSSPSPS